MSNQQIQYSKIDAEFNIKFESDKNTELSNYMWNLNYANKYHKLSRGTLCKTKT